MNEFKYDIPGSVILDGNKTITELPGNREIEGDLSLQYCTSLHHLPEELVVELDLDISYSGVESFPKSFFVAGTINGSHSQLRSISTLQRTDDDLILSGCEVLEEMPDLLLVNGNLDLSYCSSLKHLPRQLIVRGKLNVQGTEIMSLPEYLLVGGDICLSNTPITHLPAQMQVGGYLELSGCTQLTALPPQLQVRTFLNLFGSGVECFTDAEGLKVGGIVVNPSGSLITKRNGKLLALPNLTDDLSTENLLNSSRVASDIIFMGKGYFISFENKLWRIIFSHKDSYVVQDLCLGEADGGAYMLYRGEDGHYLLDFLSDLPTEDFSNEWFGKAFPPYM